MDSLFLIEAFHSPTGQIFTLDGITNSIKTFLAEDPAATYNLIIGSDSHEREETKNKRIIQVVTAIVVHRKGFGGRYFWYKGGKERVYSLREKIYKETIQSLDIARLFVPQIRFALSGIPTRYSLEIHVDVGDYGETRAMIKEVVGMVTGFGYVAKTKPESYAASYVADKHT